jgi:hypothetical protein
MTTELEVARELRPARRVSDRSARWSRSLQKLAVLLTLVGVVGSAFRHLEFTSSANDGGLDVKVVSDQLDWAEFLREVSQVLLPVAVLLALSLMVRGAGAMLAVDVVRAELAAAERSSADR